MYCILGTDLKKNEQSVEGKILTFEIDIIDIHMNNHGSSIKVN